jgi:WhiB family transcriptional regulator, redox-sensing transcriptional regulator
MDNEWMADGKCAERPPGVFFPSDGVGVEVAKRICAGCEVKAICLEYALRNRIDHGVWGGTSERERRRILRRRRLDREGISELEDAADHVPAELD